MDLKGLEPRVGIYTRYHPSRVETPFCMYRMNYRTDIFLFRVSGPRGRRCVDFIEVKISLEIFLLMLE